MTTLLSLLRSSRENVWFYRLDIGKAVEWIDWCVSKCQTADQILHALSLRNKTCAQSARLRPRWRNNDEQQLPRTSGCSGTLAPFFLFPLIYYCKQARKLSDRRHKYLFLSSLCKICINPVFSLCIQFSKMLFKHQNIRFNQPAQQMELFIYLSVVPFKIDTILSSLLQIFNWKSLYTNILNYMPSFHTLNWELRLHKCQTK